MPVDVPSMSAVGQNVSGAQSSTNGPSNIFGIFRAKCTDPKDPDKSGKIKVWIPELSYKKDEDTEGIWARPATPYAAVNLEKKEVNDFGSLYVPPKDSYVYVFFENGDPSKCVYFAGMVLEGSIPTECQSGSQYWNKHVIIKTPKKRIIFVSDDPSDACVIIRGQSS